MIKALLISFAFIGLITCSGDEQTNGANELTSTDDMATSNCAVDTRGEEYVPNMSKTGPAGFQFKLRNALPAPPDRNLNEWSLEIKNSANQNVPKDHSIELSPYMPDHQHGSITSPIVEVDELGIYNISNIDLFMPGFWEITVTILDTEKAKLDSVRFNFCIRG